MEFQQDDYKYVIQSIGTVCLGARYTYGEMLEDEKVPFKFQAIIQQYLLKNAEKKTSIKDHLRAMTEDELSYMVYEQLKIKLKGLVPTKVVKRNKETVKWESKVITLQEFLGDKKYLLDETFCMEEIQIPKLKLMAFSI